MTIKVLHTRKTFRNSYDEEKIRSFNIKNLLIRINIIKVCLIFDLTMPDLYKFKTHETETTQGGLKEKKKSK